MTAVMPAGSGNVSSLSAPFNTGEAQPLRAALLAQPAPALASRRPLPSESSPIVDRALEQHGILVSRLSALGVQTIVLPAHAGDGLGSLCADAAVMFPDGAFLVRPSEVPRRAVVSAVEAALTAAGVPVIGRVASPGLFDGGDALFSGDTLYLGVAQSRASDVGVHAWQRGNAHGREQLAAYARAKNWKVVEVAVSAAAPRLRAVASLLAPDVALVASGLCDAAAFAGKDVLDAPLGEDFAAGVLPLGNRRVLTNLRFRQTVPMLRKAKFIVEAIDLWEFGKIGATPSLLALALKRG
jgi:dimethylargininase